MICIICIIFIICIICMICMICKICMIWIVCVKPLVRWATGKRLSNRLPNLSLTTLVRNMKDRPLSYSVSADWVAQWLDLTISNKRSTLGSIRPPADNILRGWPGPSPAPGFSFIWPPSLVVRFFHRGSLNLKSLSPPSAEKTEIRRLPGPEPRTFCSQSVGLLVLVKG